MDVGVVVLVDLVLLVLGEGAQRGLEVAGGVLGADHEADLAGWVGGDGGVGVLDGGEDLLAVGLELGDEWEVKPLVLGYGGETVSLFGRVRGVRFMLGGM